MFKKKLRSPQWLRNLKFKKYPFWRLDKIRNIQIIGNGGWHFAYLNTPENISNKIKSFAHGEFNRETNIEVENIRYKIEKGLDVFGRGYNLEKIEVDRSFPDYIYNNQKKFKDWIA